MFSAVKAVDERNISLFQKAPTQKSLPTTSTNNNSSIEELQQRTLQLQEQSRANQATAELDEEIIQSQEQSAQLMQLSLRMFLDVVDRQTEVVRLDLAQQLFGKTSPRRDSLTHSSPLILPPLSPTPSPTSTPSLNSSLASIPRALDVKNGGTLQGSQIGYKSKQDLRNLLVVLFCTGIFLGNEWKNRTLLELEQATCGLATTSTSNLDYDEKLLASRRILHIMNQLKLESHHAKCLSESDVVRKEINVQHDYLMQVTNHPHRALLGLSGKWLHFLISQHNLLALYSLQKMCFNLFTVFYFGFFFCSETRHCRG